MSDPSTPTDRAALIARLHKNSEASALYGTHYQGWLIEAAAALSEADRDLEAFRNEVRLKVEAIRELTHERNDISRELADARAKLELIRTFALSAQARSHSETDGAFAVVMDLAMALVDAEQKLAVQAATIEAVKALHPFRIGRDDTVGVPALWQADVLRIFSRTDTTEAVNEGYIRHTECDCVPDLGPSHCHLCSEKLGKPIAWDEAGLLEGHRAALTEKAGADDE